MLCVLNGKTIGAKCNLKVAFSFNSWIYNKKVIIQLSVQYRIYLDSCPDNFIILDELIGDVVILALVQLYNL